MPTPSLAAIPTQFFRAQEQQDGALDPALCTASYQANLVGFPAMDIEGHSAFGRMFYAGFPDLVHGIDTIVEGTDTVTVRFTLRGTHTGPFLHIAATGRSIAVSAMAVMTIAQGRVARLDGMFDQLGLLRQLGAIAA